MTRRLALALALLAAPTLAHAQQLLGTITATLGDGPSQAWYITAEGDESQSALTKTPGVPLHDVSLWGNTAETETASLKGALLLDFMVMSAGGAATAMDPVLQYLAEGYGGMYVAQSDGALSLTVTRFEEVGDGIAMAGTFSATAAFTDSPATMATDPTKTLPITGSFEVTLPVQ